MEEISKELEMMAAEDQKAINSLDPSIVLLENTERLKEIISLYGWPTISKFGLKASRAAWLITQHSDHDLEFQKNSLGVMKSLAPGEIESKNIAYLEDRVLVAEGFSQLYGTQFYVDEQGEYVPRPIKDEENIESRWKEMQVGGSMWPSFEDYKKFVLESYLKKKH